MPLELIHFECSNSRLFLKLIRVYVMSITLVWTSLFFKLSFTSLYKPWKQFWIKKESRSCCNFITWFYDDKVDILNYYTVLFQLILYSFVLKTLSSCQFVLVPINQHDNSIFYFVIIISVSVNNNLSRSLFTISLIIRIYDELLVLFNTNNISALEYAFSIGKGSGIRHLPISISSIFKDAS